MCVYGCTYIHRYIDVLAPVPPIYPWQRNTSPALARATSTIEFNEIPLSRVINIDYNGLYLALLSLSLTSRRIFNLSLSCSRPASRLEAAAAAAYTAQVPTPCGYSSVVRSFARALYAPFEKEKAEVECERGRKMRGYTRW